MCGESNIGATKFQHRVRKTIEAVVNTITVAITAHPSSSSAEIWRVTGIWPHRQLSGQSLGIVILNTAALIASAMAAADASSTAP